MTHSDRYSGDIEHLWEVTDEQWISKAIDHRDIGVLS